MRPQFKGKWEFLNASMKGKEGKKIIKNFRKAQRSMHEDTDG